ncbi:signal peptidase I [Butyrivibrio sp. NC3005]|jgi:signal peptidase I|uniref:signal peptidase I n=1 Tax=Butyrivibrio sp. NC3005 TaxID=1280685 RepID=UPI000425A250|nr:signal peptidase I [Butyrivibrio sp. NC3005]
MNELQEKEMLENTKEDTNRENPVKEFFSWLLYVAGVILLTFLFITFVAQKTEVSGRSMLNTLHDRDSLIVSKISYELGTPNRFDIVVFPHINKATNEKTFFIKRIIGMPGETVQIDFNGNIYINGEVLDEHFGKETIQNPGNAINPIVLGEDEYFVLGDNRNDSLDSRFTDVGKIKRDELVGKAVFRIYPFDTFGKLK